MRIQLGKLLTAFAFLDIVQLPKKALSEFIHKGHQRLRNLQQQLGKTRRCQSDTAQIGGGANQCELLLKSTTPQNLIEHETGRNYGCKLALRNFKSNQVEGGGGGGGGGYRHDL